MKDLFTATLRRMVMLTVFLSVLPALGILIFSGVQRYHEVREEVERRGLRAVQNVAERQHLITQNTFTILSALRKATALSEFSPAAFNDLFHDIVSNYPMFSNIFLASVNGDVLSSGLPVEQKINLWGASFLSRARRNHEPDVAPAAISPFTGQPVIQYVLPMTNSLGEVFAYLGAELHLQFFEAIFSDQNIPPDSVIYALNNTGALALSSMAAPIREGGFVGSVLWEAVSSAPGREGSLVYADEKGLRRIAVFRRISLTESSPPYMYIVLSVPESLAYALPEALMHRDMLLLSFAALFTLFAGMVLCYLSFGRPAKILLTVAERLSRGELSARVSDTGKLKGEFAALGREFNAMAFSLEQRSLELEKEREAASRSTKAKSEFLANMSHEIRTPMNAILGMTHLVSKTSLTEPQQTQLRKIDAAAGDLLGLLNDILDFSKIEAGKMSFEHIPFHLGRLLKIVRGGGVEAAEKAGIRLATNIPPDAPPRLVGDPTRLGQALTTLLLETIRHCDGRTVELGWMAEDRTAKDILLHFTCTVYNVHLTEEEQAGMRRCLEGQDVSSFANLDTGQLSLLLAGSILRLMGGKAIADNFSNGFRFSGVARLGLPQTRFADHVLRFDGERILILNASSISRQAFSALLSRHNLRTDECADLEDALRSMHEAEKQGFPVSLIITNLPLELAKATDFISRLKQGNDDSPPPQIILSTTLDVAGISHELYESGVDAVLPRPVNESLLVDTLSGLLWERGGREHDLAEYEAETSAEDCRFDGLRVLLAEDNAVNREIAQEVLGNAGIDVAVAKDGLEAVELCRRRPLHYDMVLMDIEMPGMDGIAATQVLRRQEGLSSWRLPIIAMTAHAGADETLAFFKAGMNDHTLKPISLNELFHAVKRWLPPEEALRAVALPVLRSLRGILELLPERAAEIPPLLEALSPYLHEGRIESLLACVARHDRESAITLIDELLNEPGRELSPGQDG